jgi:hypothetical protein
MSIFDLEIGQYLFIWNWEKSGKYSDLFQSKNSSSPEGFTSQRLTIDAS